MWAAQLRAHPTIRCVSSSRGTSEPPGTSWSPCVPVHLSHRHCAPQSCTRPASISLEQLRAGGERSFTLASFVFAGEFVLRQPENIRCYPFLTVCSYFFHRSVRFRWYQGFFSSGSAPPTWALDNIYIGPQCEEMCNGHGACVGGTHCACDPGYSGSDCSAPDTPNPDFLKEDFEGRLMRTRHLLTVSCC